GPGGGQSGPGGERVAAGDTPRGTRPCGGGSRPGGAEGSVIGGASQAAVDPPAGVHLGEWRDGGARFAGRLRPGDDDGGGLVGADRGRGGRLDRRLDLAVEGTAALRSSNRRILRPRSGYELSPAFAFSSCCRTRRSTF